MLVTVSSEVVKGWATQSIPYYESVMASILERDSYVLDYYERVLIMCHDALQLCEISSSFTLTINEISKLTGGMNFV